MPVGKMNDFVKCRTMEHDKTEVEGLKGLVRDSTDKKQFPCNLICFATKKSKNGFLQKQPPGVFRKKRCS